MLNAAPCAALASPTTTPSRHLGLQQPHLGIAAERFAPLWLNGPELSALSGHTLGGVVIDNNGSWAPQPQAPLIASGGQLDVVLPPASAVLLRSL